MQTQAEPISKNCSANTYIISLAYPQPPSYNIYQRTDRHTDKTEAQTNKQPDIQTNTQTDKRIAFASADTKTTILLFLFSLSPTLQTTGQSRMGSFQSTFFLHHYLFFLSIGVDQAKRHLLQADGAATQA